MMNCGLSLVEIDKQFNMSEYQGWDRDSHFPWMAETIYRELKGEGPQIVPSEMRRRAHRNRPLGYFSTLVSVLASSRRACAAASSAP